MPGETVEGNVHTAGQVFIVALRRGAYIQDQSMTWAMRCSSLSSFAVEVVRFFFFNSFRTVVGLTCNTCAVSRIPLAFRAISTIWRFTSGDYPA